MSMTRRELLATTAAAASAMVLESQAARAETAAIPIIDTHQHLWDRSRFRLPWLDSAPEILRRDYGPAEYAGATEGLGIDKAIYMEVDVTPEQHVAEAEALFELSRKANTPTRAAVVGGRPASADFRAYLDRLGKNPAFKGVRQVLHSGETPPGTCLSDAFIRGVRLLGERGLSFDLCMRPGELEDGLRLVEACPGTRFILDHCGNADVNVFRKKANTDEKPGHDPDAWRRSIERLAGKPNVVGKISGIVARARKGFTPDDLAPVVNHCLDCFGPDRVVFGGDWPVCLLGSSYRGWVEALRAIVAARSLADQKKLWHENAARIYGV